ncbi:MAG: AmmeMemoRadiSam system radical SAM enzyme [bacterium]|nr:AmmeMemoRadiSam system radical SAM enzyme [bacterium]
MTDKVQTAAGKSLWSTLREDGRQECRLCPRHCRMKEGQRGFCFIRQNQRGKIVNTAYATSLGFQIDPIEKKPLNHFYPGTTALSFGTAGCNLGCTFCQNWHLSRAKQVEESSSAVRPEVIAAAAKRHHCQSVAFTYNDPIIWADYAMEVAQACHELGVQTVAVSNGYMEPEPRRQFYAHMDAANIDLKAFTESFYRRYCLADLHTVMDTLVYIKKETNVWLEITTLIIPGLNDNPEEMKQQSRWMVRELGEDVPLHLTAFHPTFRMTDREATPLETLLGLRQIALSEGLKYVYTGNVMSPETQSTYCPRCGELLIERHWHRLEAKKLPNGKCAKCGLALAGRYA